jgi:hypothetical protein
MTTIDTDGQPPRTVEITAPRPGVAVLACRCGTVLSLTEPHTLRYFTGPKITPIVCRHCAEQVGARP